MTNRTISPFSLIDSLNLKSISILIIVLHNYLHWTNSIGENEMSLKETRIFDLISHITTTPIGSFNYLISYFGWYFITPFIFISGYGLTIKSQKKEASILHIMLQALFKTMILLLIGTIYIYITGYMPLNESITIFIKKLSTVDNLFRHTVFSGIGPWWYFSLAIQLYILFPLVLRLINKFGSLTIMITSYIIIYLFYYYASSLNIFGTAIGHLPELILGIAIANDKFNLTKKTIIPIFVFLVLILVLSNRYSAFFPFTYLTFLSLFLIIFFCYKDKINYKFFYYIGIISPFIFLLNGPIRKYTMSIKPYLETNFSKSSYEILIFATSLSHLLAVIMVSTLLFIISKKAIDLSNTLFDSFIKKV